MNGECDKCGEHALECNCKTIKNKRLTLEDRKLIENLLHQKIKHKDICKIVGIHPTTLYRDIKKCKEEYNAEEAHGNTSQSKNLIDWEIIGKRMDCCKESMSDSVNISKEDLLELIYWARRYCDGRSTYAPTRFNWIYQRIRSQYPDLLRCKDQFDETLKDKGAYWPYAQDGMYNEKTGAYDARK